MKGWIHSTVAPGVGWGDGGLSVDEVGLLDALLRRRRGPEHVLVDVGAHHGGSLAGFAERGWTVLAFEPDDVNRRALTKHHGNRPNVRIDARAVSDVTGQQSFYRSETSSGISSLTPFHHDHEAQGLVETVTLAETLNEASVETVDVLKVDVEGHDLAVLRGNDWGRWVPDVVVVEFEDAKTLPMGHVHGDLASFLQERGYVVLVSEWYPIVRYGARHHHRRLVVHPTPLRDPAAWGNLVAFTDPRLARAYRLRMAVARGSGRLIHNRLVRRLRGLEVGGV